MAPKRPAPEPIILISDDEDDQTPSRGDIRPTTFKAKVAAFAYNPAADERETKQKLRQIYDVFGDRFPSDRVRGALKACKNDVEAAIVYLEDQQRDPPPESPSLPPPKPNGRRLVSKGAMKGSASNPVLLSRDSSPVASPSPPKQPKRRLVQGLRRRNDSFSQEVASQPEPPSSDDPLVIDLVENDKEDEYEAELSPEPEDDDDDRVLNCINESTAKELAAMTGMKENLLEPLMEKRPFIDLAQAKRVSTNKKPGARKSARVSIGETVVEAVEIFLNAVSAIDEVVAQCEIKAQAVKSVIDTWDLDTFGHHKRSERATPDRDLPPTPTSVGSSRYTRPPIPQQPHIMDGHCVMKSFQLFGLNWMSVLYNYDIGCILADEMGLGKTCQVISFISHLVDDYQVNPRGRRPWPNLIVVPPSTYNNWLIEFDKFAPDLSVVGYRGSQSERAEIAWDIKHEPEAYHVVLATYSQINSEDDIEAMQSIRVNCAVFDEGHKMKNPETKIYRDLKRIPAAWKMLLTGTPVQNNLMEMTALLSFINPQMFSGCMEHIRYIFSQKVTIRDVSNGAFLYSERVKRARTILEPFILQRRKDQVLSDMPRKINTVVQCEMTETQEPVYREYEETFKLEPSQRVGRAQGRQNDQNNVWMQLRKAALHPLLFRRHFTDEKVEAMGRILMDRVPQSELHQTEIRHLVQELKNSSDFELHLWCRDYPKLLKQFDIPAAAELDSGKVRKLLELIEQYQKNGDRVLVFSKFSRLIELLREVLALQGIDHRILMGNTNVAERQTLIDEFNDDASIPVFLLTTGAGGTGINLTAANKVIIFDQSDNPQDDIQAENRAHRLGQKRDVEVVRLISSGTMEELIYKACQKKIELANKVTGAVEEDESEAGANLEQEVRKMMEAQEKMTPP
ncbi:helicase SWR1 [Purpureocillium lilacinum]|nr:helicase SWR1 [Purpureocillium lilacinum]OAQ81523.1 helicase SWR1 [Purpureocillium lilacinum]OAQ91578.1 helicase SWR1 [Purpureocillium lilacinum]GJN72932.1 hypothetical protein PLICBS_007008 [Purpureocillium lilacinum]GJN83450.1 hypothetical protein PLIIFM63780_006999 [Purpureocillium lilacinum]